MDCLHIGWNCFENKFYKIKNLATICVCLPVCTVFTNHVISRKLLWDALINDSAYYALLYYVMFCYVLFLNTWVKPTYIF